MKKQQVISKAAEKLSGTFTIRTNSPSADLKSNYFLYQINDGEYQMPGMHGKLIAHGNTLTQIYNELSSNDYN